jgi:hypothetical protein
MNNRLQIYRILTCMSESYLCSYKQKLILLFPKRKDMKKIMLALMLLVTVSAASAQDFRVGAKGFFNSTWLFNNNISDRGNDADYVASFGVTTGITSALYFTGDLAVSLDLFYTWHNQTLTGVLASGSDAYTSSTTVNYLDIPILFHVSSEGGPYVELGPQVSLLLGAKETYDDVSSTLGHVVVSKDFKNDFSGLNLAGVLGFGYDIEASDQVLINVGLRFGYGITDATKKFSEAELAATDHGTISSFAHTSATTGAYDYHKTNRAFGGLSVGVVYKPGK